MLILIVNKKQRLGYRMNNWSSNLVKTNIEKIGNIFPELLIEDKNEDGEIVKRIDLEKLAILVGEINIPLDEFEYQFKYVERYLFDWPGKKMAIAESLKQSTSTLLPCLSKSLNWEQAKHLYLEGDNLEVLKLLLTSYQNSIEMIYIDPPYNTGKSFIYDDNYKDGINSYLKRSNSMLKNHSQSDGRYHTGWLNMMYPRLRLAKELLSKDGAIFISIEDNELANLKRICDEIFGEDNFVSIITVENNAKGRKNSKYISQSCDYCLIYAKDINKGSFVENIPKNINEMKLDESGKFVHKSGKRILVGNNEFNDKVENFSSDKHYSTYIHLDNYDLICRKENDIHTIDQELIDLGYKRYISYREDHFVENTYTMQKLQTLFEEEALEIKEEKIYEKNFKDTIRMKNLLTSKKYTAIVNASELDYKMDVSTTAAGNTIKELFETDKPLFDSPKPVDLIQNFITLFESKTITVLDFFAGSSTTAQAVVQQNMIDNGDRQCILIQIPEIIDQKDQAYKMGYRTITDLGIDRFKKAIQKLSLSVTNTESKEIGFRVFSLASSNIESSTDNKTKITPIEGRNQEDLLFELLLKNGGSLTDSISTVEIDKKILTVQEKSNIAICLDDKLELADLKAIEEHFVKSKKMKCFIQIPKKMYSQLDKKSIFKML